MLGALLPLAVYALVLALHVALPGRWVEGYVEDPGTGRRRRYHLNGPRVLAAVLGAYAGAAVLGWLPWDLFYAHRLAGAAGAAVLGLACVAAVPREENVQWGGGRVDAKMFLYLAGAVLLELNVLSSVAHNPTPGAVAHAAMFSFFVVDYLSFEEVHLYTWDFFAERVGFKLIWGCLAFYPYFYNVGLWGTARLPDPHTPPVAIAACVALFLGGWVLSRGANLQKFLFKTRPEARLLGVLAPVALEDGGRRLLVGGFWGLARHVNYLGEVAMALGLALVLGHPGSPWPWLYPLYYVALLVPRERADDRRCAAKYGALWEEYRRRVPYRIIPGVY